MGFYYVVRHGQVVQLRSDHQVLDERAKNLADMVKEVKQLETQIDDLNKLIDTILKLENSRRGPVKVLMEISARIPKKRAWLTELKQTDSLLTIRGVAMDNETIAEFMSNLEGPEPAPVKEPAAEGEESAEDMEPPNIFQNIELVRSAQEIQESLRLKGFSINCTVVLEKEEPEDDEQAKTKKP